MLACFYTLSSMLAFLVLGFATPDAFSGFVVVWLHLTPTRSCLDVTIRDALPWCLLLYAYLSPFLLCAMILLTMLVYATHWLSMHLYTLVYMFMHESWLLVCCTYFNKMKLWTLDLNLHLSLADTPFCLLSCLFTFCLFVSFLACLPPRLFAHILVSMLDMSITPICFMPFPTFSALFPSIAYLLVSCFCIYTYTYGMRTHGARAWFPKRKQKGAGASMSI